MTEAVRNKTKIDLSGLTSREREVLRLIAEGLSVSEISKVLYRSEKTVQSHRLSIGRKLGARNRVELARIAITAGMVSAPGHGPGATGTMAGTEGAAPAKGASLEPKDALLNCLVQPAPVYSICLRRKIRWFSPLVHQLLGHEKLDLGDGLGMWFTLVHPDDRPKVRKAMEEVWAGCESINLTYRLLCHDMKIVWVRETAHRLGRPQFQNDMMVGFVLPLCTPPKEM